MQGLPARFFFGLKMAEGSSLIWAAKDRKGQIGEFIPYFPMNDTKDNQDA